MGMDEWKKCDLGCSEYGKCKHQCKDHHQGNLENINIIK
jgi:hypothetical protein